MARWIELTESRSERAMFVNIELAISFQRDVINDHTSITFVSDLSSGVITVLETPEQIVSSMKNRPGAQMTTLRKAPTFSFLYQAHD